MCSTLHDSLICSFVCTFDYSLVSNPYYYRHKIFQRKKISQKTALPIHDPFMLKRFQYLIGDNYQKFV